MLPMKCLYEAVFKFGVFKKTCCDSGSTGGSSGSSGIFESKANNS